MITQAGSLSYVELATMLFTRCEIPLLNPKPSAMTSTLHFRLKWCANSLLFVALCYSPVMSQVPKANEDESLVVMSPLPDPLLRVDGTRITDAKDWPAQRARLLQLIAEHEYGAAPTEKASVTWELVEQGLMNNDKTKRQQFVVHIKTDAASLDVDLALFTPNQSGKVKGTFLGLNFQGNHTIDSSPALRLPKSWVANDTKTGVTENRATESNRGAQERRWPIAEITERGYAVATAYYGDIDPDFDDGFKNGVHSLFPTHRASAEHRDRWGTVAGWAWGLSRLMDVLIQQPNIDPDRVAVIGHSRLGKTSLWAGATDPRFALVIANNSGCGGAALERRNFGETVARINTSFPHWFCPKFKDYNQNESAMPFDQHTIVACIAPRPIYIASATKDLWADPKGEYLSGWYASPVYKLLGFNGLPTEEPPTPDTSVGDRIGYHNRTGPHDILSFDWQQYMNFADRHWK